MSEDAALAVVVGASTHQSAAYAPLPGAVGDADAIRRTLRDQGLDDQNILHLTGPEVTRTSLLDAVRNWPRDVSRGPVRLFVFFSGHGTIVNARGLGDLNVLVTHDTDPADPAGTGLEFNDLVRAIEHGRPKELYVFIDACYTGDSQPGHDRDGTLLSYVNAETVLGMFAAPGQLAFETEGEDAAGFLMTAVIEALSASEPMSVGPFAQQIVKQVRSASSSVPTTVIRGDVEAVPAAFALSPTASRLNSGLDAVPRPEPVATVCDAISRHRTVWLFGDHGSGKTTLAAMIAESRENPTIVVSIPPEMDDLDEVRIHLAASIAEQTTEVFPSGRAPIDGFEGALRAVSRSPSDYLLVVDHLERVHGEATELAARTVGSFEKDILMISETKRPGAIGCEPVEMPQLSPEETEAFVQRYAPSVSSVSNVALRWAASANPLELRARLIGTTSPAEITPETVFTEEELQIIDTLLASRGCHSIEVFQRVTGADPIATRRLVLGGLIVRNGDTFACHDSLADERPARAVSVRQPSAIAYWSAEVEQAYSLPEASRTLATLTLEADLHDGFLRLIDVIVGNLFDLRDWSLIEQIASRVVDSDPSQQWANACLALARVFVQTARHDQAKVILEQLREVPHFLDSDLECQIEILESERLWWYGEFGDAIALTNRLIEQRDVPTARLSRGIAHWFSGHWAAADEDFRVVLSEASSDRRTAGWAHLMLASSLGLRGRRIDEVREHFQTGANLLTLSGDDVGLAILWGNYGEVSWKLGYYEDAEIQLERALFLANTACGESQIVEIRRSVIETELRRSGPRSRELERALDETLSIYDETSMGPTVQMQLLNTLATVDAVRGNRKSAARFVESVESLTNTNPEYEIYTMANRAAIAMLDRDLDQAQVHFDSAIGLAEEGGNELAPLQVRQAIELLNTHAGLPSKIQLAIRERFLEKS